MPSENAYIWDHVRTDHPEQQTPSLCLRRWHERAGFPRPQLSAAVERGAEPGPAGHPAQPSERGNLSRSVALGPHPALVQGPERRTEADKRQVRDGTEFADIPRRVSHATLH